jgi:hypothetical protein
MFQLPRDTRASKQGSELPRPISKGKLDFSSSLIIPCADLCENLMIWQGDGCQMGKSALRRPGTHLKYLSSRIVHGQLYSMSMRSNAVAIEHRSWSVQLVSRKLLGGVFLHLKPSYLVISLLLSRMMLGSATPATSGLGSSSSLSYLARLNVDTLPLGALAWPSDRNNGTQSRLYRLTPRSLTFEGLFPPSWGLLCLRMCLLGFLNQSSWSLGQFSPYQHMCWVLIRSKFEVFWPVLKKLNQAKYPPFLETRRSLAGIV